uniref:BZIP domain-containing protein n=1 Tax=Timema tahoe TaxID=61484 RepID=A0A7R9NY41_9NEOP|nr:unnamed protein product [Timema tahoe]
MLKRFEKGFNLSNERLTSLGMWPKASSSHGLICLWGGGRRLNPSWNTAQQKWPQQAQQQQSILKQQQQQPTFLVTTRANLFNTPNRIVFPKLNIKVEPISSGQTVFSKPDLDSNPDNLVIGSLVYFESDTLDHATTEAGFPLPPTPPSSTTSDSESNLSPDHEVSPLHHRSPGATTTSPRLFLSTNRQPIQTPLISTQQKGSTGTLILTEEEKRTLLAEGYPIPTRLPLTKTEEKSLKKIRRKIKNKISAQESRRKKKEYMDALEKKVEILVMENNDFKNKIESLEDKNAGLLNQLRTLQTLVTRGSLSGRHTDTPAINSVSFISFIQPGGIVVQDINLSIVWAASGVEYQILILSRCIEGGFS